jgi:hypothetical protein
MRTAFRALTRAPGYTIASVASICLGVSVSTLLFAILNGVYLRPLPYHNPEQLFVIRSAETGEAQKGLSFSGLDVDAWEQEAKSLQGIAAFRVSYASVETPEGTTRIREAEVSDGWFRVLGVYPAIGRYFSKQDQNGATPEVVLISDHFWRAHLGGEPNIVGQPLKVGRRTF